MKKIVKVTVKVVILVMVIGLVINQLNAMVWMFRMTIDAIGITYDKTWGIGIVTKHYGTWYKTVIDWIGYITLRPAIAYILLMLKDVINGKKVFIKKTGVAA